MLTLFGAAACNEETEEPKAPTENSIPGKEVGIRQLKVSVPRLTRFERVADHISCRINLRGKADRVNYPINIFISADEDSVYIEADDPVLSELPHQMYHLNAIILPHRSIASREESTETEDTIYVGARLSIEDPNNIHFRSSMRAGMNTIGSGTAEDPIIIASGDDFMTRISDPMTRGETHEGKYFEITRNINLNLSSVTYGNGWEPAGHNSISGGSTDFNGTIDGCDNYIENLFSNSVAGSGGLFYSLGEKAYIHNLEMKNVLFSGVSNSGALACYSKKGCRLDSIEVNGSIHGKENIGGLIGSGDADIRVCISSVNIVSEGDSYTRGSVGGFVGLGGEVNFTDCIRTGRIDGPKTDFVGGFIGGDKKTTSATFTRCYVCGTVSGMSFVGGFIGEGKCEFTACYAGATLPQNSYAYSTRWDIFGLNQKATPMPLEVAGEGDAVGGFVGSAITLAIHGENAFIYESPAKPCITGDNCVGALAGEADYIGEPGAQFTSSAYIKGENAVGGIIGSIDFQGEGTFINNGNIYGFHSVGGVIGTAESKVKEETFKIRCKNTGNVQGKSKVGGVIGNLEEPAEGCILENDGNVEATEDYAGGLFGYCEDIELHKDSHVGSANGSLKISGRSHVGGVSGHIEGIPGRVQCKSYCRVYANIISSGGCAGGIFGSAMSNRESTYEYKFFGEHSPIHVSITVTGGDNVGGAIGRFETAAVKRESKDLYIEGFDDMLQATITTTGNIAGGIVGRVCRLSDDDLNINFRNCHSFTTIKSTATGEVSGFGGIVGWYENANGDQDHDLKVTKCSNHGSLSGPNMTAAGGIIGYAQACRVTSCYNAGTVDAVMSVGGIVGRINGDSYVANCFNMGEVPSKSGRKWLAGIVGQKEDSNSLDVTIEACYNVGQTGWGIVGGEDKANIIRKNCLYLSTASNGDMSGKGSDDVSANYLRSNNWFYGFNYISVWKSNAGKGAPTLQGVPMFNEKLPLEQ